jgi:hypothetical protein
MDEKLQLVKPYGYIYANGEQYYLLRPEPLSKDSWQGDNTYRFLVVPVIPDAIEEVGTKVYHVYPYRRHIVTNNFTIEFMYDLEEIHVPVLDEIDVTSTEAQYDKE